MNQSSKPIARQLAIIKLKQIIKDHPSARISRGFLRENLEKQKINCTESVLKDTLTKSGHFKYNKDYNSWEIK